MDIALRVPVGLLALTLTAFFAAGCINLEVTPDPAVHVPGYGACIKLTCDLPISHCRLRPGGCK